MTRTSLTLHAIAAAVAVPLAMLGAAAPAYADDVAQPGVEIGPDVEVGSAVEIGPAAPLADDLADYISNGSPYTLQPPPD